MKYIIPRLDQEGRQDHDRRPTSISHMWEILSRDFGSFWKASCLCLLAIIPGGLVIAGGVLSNIWPLILVGGILIGVLGAPFFCGLLDTLLRAIRDEHGYWWGTYKRNWHQNWRDSLIPGVLLGLWGGIWGISLYLCVLLENIPIYVWIALLGGGMVSIGFFNYIFCQIPLVTLPLIAILRNAAFMFIGFLPRTVAVMVIQSVYWLLIAIAIPYNIPILAAVGFWLPCLLSTWTIYAGLEHIFPIEQTVKE